MRKTMGASQAQLLGQFLIESLVIATVAMIVAIAGLELIIPLFNNAWLVYVRGVTRHG
jgi:putative ABC transport system permease protein